MGRTKAARPRKRIATPSEQAPTSFYALAADRPVAPPTATNVGVFGSAGPLLTPPKSSHFALDSSSKKDSPALPADGSAAQRPRPSLPFGGLKLPVGAGKRPRNGVNSDENRRKKVPMDVETNGDDGGGKSGTEELEYEEEEEGVEVATAEVEKQEKMVTIAASELDRWQQKVIFQVEDHFSNEQLKRIAEFGRVHANLLLEAKEYVFNVERQLHAQLEAERASLRSQAEEFVAKVTRENEALRARVLALETENARLRRARTDPEQTVDAVDEDVAMAPPHNHDEEIDAETLAPVEHAETIGSNDASDSKTKTTKDEQPKSPPRRPPSPDPGTKSSQTAPLDDEQDNIDGQAQATTDARATAVPRCHVLLLEVVGAPQDSAQSVGEAVAG